jgi:flagellar hook-basal body complex protein FliE
VKPIIRKPDPGGCGKQPVKGASVRTIAAIPTAYDLSQSRWNPQAVVRDPIPACHEPQEFAMNVTLKPFDFAQAVARAGLTRDGQPLKSTAPVAGAGFHDALTQALGAVSKSQNDATELQRRVQLDDPNVSLEQTMVALQKSQIGFQATLQVRNKLVQAYTDIMGMQV